MPVTSPEPILSHLYDNEVLIEFDPVDHRYLVTDSGNGIVSAPCPSVTTIIGCLDKSESLIPWATSEMSRRALELLKASDPNNLTNSIHLAWLLEHARDTWRKTRQKAADIGTVVHTLLEQELKARSGLGPRPILPVQSDDPVASALSPEQLNQANAAIDAGRRYFDEHQIEVLQAESPRFSRLHGYIGTDDLIARVDGILSVLDYKTSKRLYPTVWLQTAAYQQAWSEEFPAIPLEQRVAVNVRRNGELEVQTRDNETIDGDARAFLALLEVWRWKRDNR